MITKTYDIELKKSIVKTLLYYDIFRYPLRAEEVYHYLDRNSVTINDVRAELQKLAEDDLIFACGNFYSIEKNVALVERRLKGKDFAERSMSIAKKKARIIASFPFVRGVMASGSLSKGYMDESSDIDFFIITAPKRVWIARMLLVAYKKFFLRNSHKHFCINYFIDEEHLEIEEKNIFTATELVSLLPLFSRTHYIRLIERNEHWLKKVFPNYKMRSIDGVDQKEINAFKRVCENMINIFGGRAIEKVFMRITLAYWRKRYWKKYSTDDFNLAFKSREYVSKNHPRNFQKSVMGQLSSRIAAFQIENVKSEI